MLEIVKMWVAHINKCSIQPLMVQVRRRVPTAIVAGDSMDGVRILQEVLPRQIRHGIQSQGTVGGYECESVYGYGNVLCVSLKCKKKINQSIHNSVILDFFGNIYQNEGSDDGVLLSRDED